MEFGSLLQKRMKGTCDDRGPLDPESYNLSPFKAALPLLECRQVSYEGAVLAYGTSRSFSCARYEQSPLTQRPTKNYCCCRYC